MLALAAVLVLIAGPAPVMAGELAGAGPNPSDITAQAQRARQASRKPGYRRSARRHRGKGQRWKSHRWPRARAVIPATAAPGSIELRALLFGSIPATLTDRTVTDADVFTAIAALPPSEPEPAPVRAVKTESYRRPGVAYAATAQAAPAAPRADADRCRQLAVVLLVVIFISAAGGVIGAAFVSRR